MKALQFRIICFWFLGTGVFTGIAKYPWNVAVLVVGLLVGYGLTYIWFPELTEHDCSL